MAPQLILAEFGNVLWKKHRAGELDGGSAEAILSAFRRSPLEVHPHGALLRPAWEIAASYGRTYYDSLYLALAVTGEGRMVTADRRFHDALAGTPVERHLLWIGEV